MVIGMAAQRQVENWRHGWAINGYHTRNGKLSREYTTQLEVIIFNWGTQISKSHEEQWKKRFGELAAYKQTNGDCNVSTKTGDKLGNLVNNQHKLYKKGKFSRERITQLEGISFNWSAWQSKADANVVRKLKPRVKIETLMKSQKTW